MRRALAACFLVASLFAWSRAARAEPFVGAARLGLGFGARKADEDSGSVLSLSLRGEALRHHRRRSHLRLGPAIELRTSDFRSAEGAFGFALGVDLGADTLLTSSTLLGGAYRSDRSSSAAAAQILAVGFRDWKSMPRYGAGLNLFVAFHAALATERLYEITGGAEVDLVFLATPFLLLRDHVRARRGRTRAASSPAPVPQ